MVILDKGRERCLSIVDQARGQVARFGQGRRTMLRIQVRGLVSEGLARGKIAELLQLTPARVDELAG
jgi:hypothetical protein